MSIKLFIFLTLVGLCFARNFVKENTSNDKASVVSGKFVTYAVASSTGFTEFEKAHAVLLARLAREKYGVNQMAKLTAYLRDLYDESFSGFWNCMAGYQGLGDYSGWRVFKHIHLISQAGDGQIFMCSQGCNNGACTKFGGNL